jgi:hypothetical protein
MKSIEENKKKVTNIIAFEHLEFIFFAEKVTELFSKLKRVQKSEFFSNFVVRVKQFLIFLK